MDDRREWNREEDYPGRAVGHAAAVDRIASEAAPLVGDEVADQFLNIVFAELARLPGASMKIAYLLDKARTNRRWAELCRDSAAKGGEHAPMFAESARIHDRMADVLERRAAALHDAATAPPAPAA